MQMLSLKRGDTAIGIYIKLMNRAREAVDLTGTAIKFILKDSSGNVVLNKEITSTNPLNGEVEFLFTPNEIDIAGEMQGEIEITYPNGLRETLPNSGYIPVIIHDKIIPPTTPISIVYNGGTFTISTFERVIGGGTFLDSTTNIISGGTF